VVKGTTDSGAVSVIGGLFFTVVDQKSHGVAVKRATLKYVIAAIVDAAEKVGVTAYVCEFVIFAEMGNVQPRPAGTDTAVADTQRTAGRVSRIGAGNSASREKADAARFDDAVNGLIAVRLWGRVAQKTDSVSGSQGFGTGNVFFRSFQGEVFDSAIGIHANGIAFRNRFIQKQNAAFPKPHQSGMRRHGDTANRKGSASQNANAEFLQFCFNFFASIGFVAGGFQKIILYCIHNVMLLPNGIKNCLSYGIKGFFVLLQIFFCYAEQEKIQEKQNDADQRSSKEAGLVRAEGFIAKIGNGTGCHGRCRGNSQENSGVLHLCPIAEQGVPQKRNNNGGHRETDGVKNDRNHERGIGGNHRQQKQADGSAKDTEQCGGFCTEAVRHGTDQKLGCGKK